MTDEKRRKGCIAKGWWRCLLVSRCTRLNQFAPTLPPFRNNHNCYYNLYTYTYIYMHIASHRTGFTPARRPRTHTLLIDRIFFTVVPSSSSSRRRRHHHHRLRCHPRDGGGGGQDKSINLRPKTDATATDSSHMRRHASGQARGSKGL